MMVKIPIEIPSNDKNVLNLFTIKALIAKSIDSRNSFKNSINKSNINQLRISIA